MKPRQGATSPTHTKRERLDVWRSSHRHFARQAMRRLLAAPLATIATLAMLGIAITVPTLLHVGVSNLQQWSGHSNAGLEINVYLKSEVSSEPSALAEWLKGQNLTLTSEFISQQQALQELAELVGESNAKLARSLPKNPLPASLRIVLAQQAQLSDRAQALVAELRARPEVEAVSFDLEWFRKAEALVDLAHRLYSAALLLLSAGVVLVIGNSVRVAIENRREEIIVAKLVGATHGYARRPFLYLGVWLGAGGALLGLLITTLCLYALTISIEPIEKAFATDLGLHGLAPQAALLVLLGSAGLGWLGAMLASAQQLHKIRPT